MNHSPLATCSPDERDLSGAAASGKRGRQAKRWLIAIATDRSASARVGSTSLAVGSAFSALRSSYGRSRERRLWW